MTKNVPDLMSQSILLTFNNISNFNGILVNCYVCLMLISTNIC